MSGKFCNYINISNIQIVWFGYLLIDDVYFYISMFTPHLTIYFTFVL